ncbi:MAG: tRNA (adenosine(37)-N6)-dimethylallyltransferase MiaA [Proteobacteria bacterium]|nr:tRNA (adenosine(37)-N6)-dimethylallyltransferase MiaA [Pseudomonadota bacterium]MBU1739053.1 tRNA (adenosine(37)-N6)-dimethylallyltransferase MiaA [Pseudomonadota bacterium]
MHPEEHRTDNPLIAIVGPTAVGKTDLVLRISSLLDAEIVSVDSMQVYRYMDIGTAKPTREEQQIVKHHLVDIVDPDDEYNVQRFVSDAGEASQKIIAEGKLPLLTGGTGLYLKAFENGLFDIPDQVAQGKSDQEPIRKKLLGELADEEGRARLHNYLEQIDPLSAARIHRNDRSRMARAIEIFESTGITWSEHLTRQHNNPSQGRRNTLKIGLATDREKLYERINKRAKAMIESGLIEEVEGLLAKGYSADLKSMQSIGYKHVTEYLVGAWNLDETVENLARDTRHYAKRQFTWFNRDHEIKWFSPVQSDEILTTITKFIEQQ